MSIHLDADDPWVKRGYGQASIEPGERPAVRGDHTGLAVGPGGRAAVGRP